MTFLKGRTRLYQPKKLNEKNVDTKKNEKINFEQSINSTEKMLWSIQLGKGRLPVDKSGVHSIDSIL